MRSLGLIKAEGVRISAAAEGGGPTGSGQKREEQLEQGSQGQGVLQEEYDSRRVPMLPGLVNAYFDRFLRELDSGRRSFHTVPSSSWSVAAGISIREASSRIMSVMSGGGGGGSRAGLTRGSSSRAAMARRRPPASPLGHSQSQSQSQSHHPLPQGAYQIALAEVVPGSSSSLPPKP